MDEQRIQAYVNLIEQLFGCASGEKLAAILQMHAEFVDAELLVVMQQYAVDLDSQGNGNAAQWLLGLAGHLAELLGIADAEAEVSREDSVQFLLEVLRLVAQSRGNAQQVYRFLVQHQDNLTESLLKILPELSAQLLTSHGEELARILYLFGNLIGQFPSGRRSLNLELCITAYQLALQVYTYEAFPEKWAITQNNLAIAYRDRIRGDRANNLEQSIAACQFGLQVFTRDAFPESWAWTQNNLAGSYSERIRGDRADNLEQAIAACQLALQVFTLAKFQKEWAMTQNTLGSAYSNRIRGDRADNLEQAIAAYQLTLHVYSHEAFPEKWAMTQNNLGNVYSNRIRGDRADNLEQAIAAYQLTLHVYSHEAFPEKWATTQNHLANAYSERIRGDRADNREQAIAACQLALQVFSLAEFPELWAMTRNIQANAYSERIQGDRADNIEQAIIAYQLALKVFTREAFPQQWATIQNNLTNAYSKRIQGDRADNLEQSIITSQLALQVFTFVEFPELWATMQNNLGASYMERIRGDRADNLEQAIAACQLALQVFTRETFLEQWAMTQYNLAKAYRDRIRGNRANNLEQAIIGYQLALQVYTYEAFPKNCRQLADDFGTFYFQQHVWQEASSNYTLALQASEILYQSAILLDSKAAELTENKDLPRRAAYALARIGNLKAAALTIELGRARGLSETLDRDKANLTQLQQTRPDLFTQYQDNITQLGNLEAQQRLRMTSNDRYRLTPEYFRTEVQRLHKNLTVTIDQIRKVRGYKDFLAQPSFDDIRQALRPGIPLVYLVPTPEGSLALIVTQEGIDDLWLDNLTESSIKKILNAWFRAYSQSQSKHQAWLDAIDQGTRQLWYPLMSPLINHLQQHNFRQATLIPTGFLSLLPLHAAWVEDSTTPIKRYYALDAIDFTYAPNARSLSTAQEIAQRIFADSILAIDEPEHTKDAIPLAPLPNSKREVEVAIATFQNPKVFTQEQATREAVLAALPHYKILHCSCHGNAELEQPLKSGLAMTGEGEKAILTLRDLLNLKLVENNQGGIRLAILSACETALAGIELADEAISLPTGLLQAGVAGVVASLWSVSEISTMVLLTRFYTLWRDQHLEPSKALITAQKWLRDAEPRDIVAHCETFIPELVSKKGDLYRSLRLDFSHPYYWAAFSYTGV